jgi:hypothetical protein
MFNLRSEIVILFRQHCGPIVTISQPAGAGCQRCMCDLKGFSMSIYSNSTKRICTLISRPSNMRGRLAPRKFPHHSGAPRRRGKVSAANCARSGQTARRTKSSRRRASWSTTGRHFSIGQKCATLVVACSRHNAVQRRPSEKSRAASTRNLATLPGRWPRRRRSSNRPATGNVSRCCLRI